MKTEELSHCTNARVSFEHFGIPKIAQWIHNHPTTMKVGRVVTNSLGTATAALGIAMGYSSFDWAAALIAGIGLSAIVASEIVYRSRTKLEDSFSSFNQGMHKVDVVLAAEQLHRFRSALFPLHGQINRLYAKLPWPRNMQRIVVFTDVAEGRGDIVAAAKAIATMQRFCPSLTFDWILKGSGAIKHGVHTFLNCEDPSKVTSRMWQSDPFEDIPGDFLLGGPVRLKLSADYIESRIRRKISGPCFAFNEIGEVDHWPYSPPSSITKYHKYIPSTFLDRLKLYLDKENLAL